MPQNVDEPPDFGTVEAEDEGWHHWRTVRVSDRAASCLDVSELPQRPANSCSSCSTIPLVAISQICADPPLR